MHCTKPNKIVFKSWFKQDKAEPNSITFAICTKHTDNNVMERNWTKCREYQSFYEWRELKHPKVTRSKNSRRKSESNTHKTEQQSETEREWEKEIEKMRWTWAKLQSIDVILLLLFAILFISWFLGVSSTATVQHVYTHSNFSLEYNAIW